MLPESITAHHEPNWPADLRIRPSSSKVINLTQGRSAAAGQGGERDEDEDEVAKQQDIETFGIAGRTWEAAYAMRYYLQPSVSSSDTTFDPPNPFDILSSSSAHTIIEVGSGTGYLSLALAPSLPPTTSIVMTDLPEVVPLLERNHLDSKKRWDEKGKTFAEVVARPLPWGDMKAVEDLLDSIAKDRKGELTIIASDLVYFPFLYPPLLRTLIALTEPLSKSNGDNQGESPTLLIAYKVRSLVREQPFWSAFGRWFTMKPVLIQERSPTSCDPSQPPPPPPSWTRFGSTDDIYIFCCHRKPSTLHHRVPISDEHLMRGGPGVPTADDQFEMMLLSDLDL
ncbi:hypothetical protein T439DRAFT_305974 [Meredithblackwellia eburnea MCA 4105]